MGEIFNDGYCEGCGAELPFCTRCEQPVFVCPVCKKNHHTVRSIRSHRWIFAFIGQVFRDWPDTFKEFQPSDKEELRAWLLCKSGHRVVIGAPLERNKSGFLQFKPNDLKVFAGQMRGQYWWPVELPNGTVAIVSPKSMSFDNLDAEEFKFVVDRVLDVIQQCTGIVPSIK